MASNEAGLRSALVHTLRYHKQLAEDALAQVTDAELLAPLPGEEDPIAVKLKHVGGNLRSRWREFLTSDGEKPDRHRDVEFELARGEGRAQVMELWERGWSELFGALEALRPEDFERVVTIRGEPHSVVQAAIRSLAHTCYHVGQIVQLAKRAAGSRWRTLSIPRGESERFRRARPVDYLAPGDAS